MLVRCMAAQRVPSPFHDGSPLNGTVGSPKPRSARNANEFGHGEPALKNHCHPPQTPRSTIGFPLPMALTTNVSR